MRILHHMARSGGTVISRCLGSMDGVVLLSEIHPAGTRLFNPLQQAHEWFGLFTAEDIGMLQKGVIGFNDGICLIQERCIEQGKTLVLRDWTHLDFTAVPFLPRTTYQLTLADTLKQRFQVINTTTVRHPIDQWLSLRRLPLMQDNLALEAFLEGYHRFAEYCSQIGFIRYEDFAHDQELQLAVLCERLEIKYDSAWRDRWVNYTKITGDPPAIRHGSTEISLRTRQLMEPSLLEMFSRNADYLHSLELLGYQHPGVF